MTDVRPWNSPRTTVRSPAGLVHPVPRLRRPRLLRRHEALLVAVAGFVALVVVDAILRDERHPVGDDVVYERMARDPLGVHTFPFAYRIAVPWLVHVLPFSHTFSFSLVAWVCSAAAGGVAYALMDAAYVLVMLAGGLFVAERRPVAFSLTVLIGAFVRESALFLVPFAYVMLGSCGSRWSDGV